MNYKDFFKDKKIAVIGLGAHGEMIADIKFLLRNKAKVSLYDMRSEKRLRGFIMDLSVSGLEKVSFGKVPAEDLLGVELILLSPEISKKSFFLRKAIEAHIQIEFPDTLFFKLAPSVTLIGVIGMYGKSTVAHLIYNILKKSFIDYKDQGLFFIDPDSTNGALTHLKKIKKGDVVLARIPEQMIQHYYEIHISPYVAVLTSLIPLKILEFQTYNNFIVAPDYVVDIIKSESNFLGRGKILRTRGSQIPTEWAIPIKSLHDRENASLALETSELFKVPLDIVREILRSFVGLRGRLEIVKKVGGIEFYNDAASITPESTLSALKSLSLNKNIILILGGAYTGYDYAKLIQEIPDHVSTFILLPGSGTLGFRQQIENQKEKLQEINIIQTFSLEEAVKIAKEHARKGDKVLYSPGFDALGVDISRKERSERFVKAVRGL